MVSVVIPTLNEEACLPLLLDDLGEQKQLAIEVLISDGGSSDRTRQVASRRLAAAAIPHQIIAGPSGRGGQMNRAADQARGEWLLFLHADSRLPDEHALATALTCLRKTAAAPDFRKVAGRFALRFQSPGSGRHAGLYFCEAKALLGERGCIHGDQGFLLTRQLFREVGPFREDLPVMEDTWLAEMVRERADWLLLPVEIRTSPRRFAAEGFGRRQLLNALLMNFLFIGWDDFLRDAPDIYRRQGQASQLDLLPFWQEIRRRLGKMPLRSRLALWLATGRFVRSQAWQVIFWREVRRCFRRGAAVDEVDFRVPRRFRTWFDPLTGHLPGHILTGVLTWVWFQLAFVVFRRRKV